MKHRSDAISKLLEGLDTIVAGHAKRTMEEDRSKKEESEGEQPIESTKDYVEKYEVEANLPEGHSEEEEEEGAERAEEGPSTEMPEYPGVEEKEHGKKMASGGASVTPLPEPGPDGEASGMPMAKPRDEKHEKRTEPAHGDDEMSQAKKELMDRLSRKPKAIRR